MKYRRVSSAVSAFLIAAVSVLGIASTAIAQDGPLPERRVITYDDIDYFGGDLRSIFNTSFDHCVSACKAEETCRAFTYNTRSDACFLKGAYDQRKPFRRAISGTMVPVPKAARERAVSRVEALTGVSERDLEKAQRFAESLPRRFALESSDPTELRADAVEAAKKGRRSAANRAQAALVVLEDSHESWLDLAALYKSWKWRDSLRDASLNAYLRAKTEEEQGEALALLGGALTTLNRGRDGLRVFKLAQALSPSAANARALSRARSRYGFRVVDHRIEADNDAPRVCVEFNDPLDGSVDYDPYIRVEGDVPLSVESDERNICLDGMEHGQSYDLTLREGLPAAEDGEALLRDIEIRIYIRDRAPAVRIATRAYILPKTENASIPVTTINVDRVALRLSRVSERNMLPMINSGLFGRRINRSSENRIETMLGEKLWEGSLEVERRLNAETVTGVPVSELIPEIEPGAYVLSARLPDDEQSHWQQAATQWFMVSDTGLATTTASDGMHVFARTLSSAKAAEGAELTLLAANNEILGTAKTDADGYARFAPGLTRGKKGNRPRVLIAKRGEADYAVLGFAGPAFDLSDRGVDGREAPGPLDIYATTERGAYRPRETVHATILARDNAADAVAGLPLTARIQRPDGVTFLEKVIDDEGAGGRSLSFALGEGAMRGTWTLGVHDDPERSALFNTTFLVEDFVPQRIEVTLSAEEDIARFGETFPITVEAEYLYGGAGSGLAVEGETLIEPVRKIDGYKGFEFGLVDEESAPQRQPLGTTYTTDADGRVTVPMEMPPAPQTTRPFTATAVLRVREGSGRAVERDLTLPVESSTPHIGIRPLFDGAVKNGQDASFDVIAVGADSERIAMDGVTWTLSRLDTRYQWYRQRGDWNYEPYTRRIRIDSGKIAMGKDKAARIETPVEWGRHELVVRWPSGEHVATSVQFNAGWYAPVAGSGTPDLLQVALDKEAYAQGDTATLRIEARQAGEALVQVVTDRLIDVKAISLPKGESEVALKVNEDWGPGAYVVASLIRPLDEAAKRNPTRALGVAYVPVDPGARALKPRFTGPDESAPRGPLDASLSIGGLAEGETAYVTVAAVDIGVLNITGFESPEPEEWYFGQRRLGVELRDIYGRLIDGLSGAPGRIRSGGGAVPGGVAPPPVEDVVAEFSGVVTVDKEGKAEISFDMPDFNGKVKLMAMAWTKSGVGSASKDVLVRDPVVTTVSTPRFLGPGDESRILVEIAHAFGPTGEVTLETETDIGISITTTDEPIAAQLDEGGRITFELPVTGDMIGDPEIRLVTVAPGGARLTKTIRLPVRANEPDILIRTPMTLVSGEEETLSASSFDDLMPGTGSATLSLGSLAALDTAGMLNDLDLYPYGCTEQTTSRALPLLYYDNVALLLGLKEAGANAKDRIQGAIRRVLARQAARGSFGLWYTGSGDYWLDAYVTDFLSRAKTLGHEVPSYAFDDALRNLKNRVGYSSDLSDEGAALAYALMVLAREGEASIGDLRYYADQQAEKFPTPMALAQLGAALAFYGEQKRADRLFMLASERVKDAGRQTGWRRDYGSNLRDASAVLALAVEAGSDAIDREALIEKIVEQSTARRYTSTQDKAWTLLAANALADEAAAADVTVNGRQLRDIVLRFDDNRGEKQKPLTLVNHADDDLAAVLSVRGKPIEPQPPMSNGYQIKREYFTLDGEFVDLETVGLNERLIVVLSVENERGRRARLMIDDPLPAGFEIDNPNLLRAGNVSALDWLGQTSDAEYTAFQTDRFLAAATGNAENLRFAYAVRAVSPGSFRHPAAQVEDMYRPEFRARTKSGTLTIAAQ